MRLRVCVDGESLQIPTTNLQLEARLRQDAKRSGDAAASSATPSAPSDVEADEALARKLQASEIAQEKERRQKEGESEKVARALAAEEQTMPATEKGPRGGDSGDDAKAPEQGWTKVQAKKTSRRRGAQS